MQGGTQRGVIDNLYVWQAANDNTYTIRCDVSANTNTSSIYNVHWRGWVDMQHGQWHVSAWHAWTDEQFNQLAQQALGGHAVPAQLVGGTQNVPNVQQQTMSDEDRARIAAQQAEQRRLYEERQAKFREISAVAEALLTKHLSPRQRELWGAGKRFVARGSKGGLYLLENGNQVHRIEPPKDVQVEMLCCHIDSNYPLGDRLLAQKLWIEHDEEDFRKTANITPLRRVA